MLARRARENRLAVEASRRLNGGRPPNRPAIEPTTIGYRDHELILQDQRREFERQLEEARRGSGGGGKELLERAEKAEAEAADLREKLATAIASVEDLTAKLAKAQADLSEADAAITELEQENTGLRERLEAEGESRKKSGSPKK